MHMCCVCVCVVVTYEQEISGMFPHFYDGLFLAIIA